MNEPDYQQNLAAIRGERLLDDLSCEEGRASIIRGIQQHHGFATSAPLMALSVEHPHFARARNARLIMSNIVPEPEEMDDRLQRQGEAALLHLASRLRERYPLPRTGRPVSLPPHGPR